LQHIYAEMGSYAVKMFHFVIYR